MKIPLLPLYIYNMLIILGRKHVSSARRARSFELSMDRSLASDKPAKKHVALFTSPGMGHLVPFCELARFLSSSFNCKVTLFAFEQFWSSKQASPYIKALNSAALDIDIVYLSAIGDSIPDTTIESRIIFIVEKSTPQVLQILRSSLSTPLPVSLLIVDFFCGSVIKPVSAFGIPTYLFVSSCTCMLTLIHTFPDLASQFAVSFKEVQFGIQLPGLPAITGKQMPGPVLDRSLPAFHSFVDLCSIARKNAAGFLINSFEELDAIALRGFRDRWPDVAPKAFAIGPITWSKQEIAGGEECLKWLDLQPPASVVYVSFGSGVTLPREQILEIAEGLEASSHRFLWVVRKQLSSRTASSYFGIAEADVEECLPQGFLKRTRDRGLVVPSWTPQIAVLSHPSTGAFISHCGWNSTLESIYHGVPIISWPMFAEQRINALMINNVYGVGMEIKENDGWVKREELERTVRELMEGENGRNVRERAKEMKGKARNAVREGGSSWRAMESALSFGGTKLPLQ